MEHGTHNYYLDLDMELRTWNSELGTWNLQLGTRNLEFGIWNLEFGTSKPQTGQSPDPSNGSGEGNRVVKSFTSKVLMF